MNPTPAPHSLKDWLSPKTVMQIGIPTAIVVFLLGVLTGLIPTPLMSALIQIEDVVADHEGQVEILDEIRYLQRVECLRRSETPNERAECYYRQAHD